jgi:hypothetical protein
VSQDDEAPTETVRQAYLARLTELSAEAEELDARDASLSRARGIGFLIAVGGAGYTLFNSSPPLWLGVAGAWAVFLMLVVRHAMVSTRQFELARRKELHQRALSRVAGEYRVAEKQLHLRGDVHVDGEHPYTGDLDVFGPSSLYEQLNTTQTPGGAERLAGWLLEPASSEVVAARQSAVRELATLDRLREEMALAGMRAGNVDRDAKPFLQWATQSSDFASKQTGLVIGSVLLASTTCGLLIAGWLVDASWTRAWVGTLVVQVVLLLALRARLEPILAPVCVKQSPLATYHGLMALLEAQRFEDPTLVDLSERLRSNDGVGASAQMQRLESLAGLAAVRHNALVYIVADVFMLWDVWCAWLLDRWRNRHGSDVQTWLDTLSELEALSSLATFTHEHPAYAWPVLATGNAHFVARDLGHPLIPEASRVVNDVTLDDDTAALMITGSNMSGKSTMLRSIGINAVLAQAGAPVCAASLSLSPLRVETSMRVGDDLDRGASRFYMEVRKLKRIVDAIDDDDAPILFLLDEVLHGTNSRERNIGAKAVVRHFVTHGTIGAVSSHDLGLVELEALTDGRVRNTHFEDHLEEDTMCFDYRMKEGPVGTSNALRLMRSVGIDVPGLEG